MVLGELSFQRDKIKLESYLILHKKLILSELKTLILKKHFKLLEENIENANYLQNINN